MKDHFLMCGRGRRPALPSLPLLNNRVLVQLFHLREQGSATWDEVSFLNVQIFFFFGIMEMLKMLNVLWCTPNFINCSYKLQDHNSI